MKKCPDHLCTGTTQMREAVRLWGPDVLWEEGTTLGGPCPQEDSSAKGSWEGLRRKQMEEEGTER